MLCHCSMFNSHMSLRSTSAHCLVGLGRVELPTSRLSGVRSNHLSYRPDGVLFGKKQKNYLRQKAYRRKDLESRKSQRDSNITLRKDRKSTRLNSSHRTISYAVFCLKKKKKK